MVELEIFQGGKMEVIMENVMPEAHHPVHGISYGEIPGLEFL
jgi:hypothetical protein